MGENEILKVTNTKVGNSVSIKNSAFTNELKDIINITIHIRTFKLMQSKMGTLRREEEEDKRKLHRF